MSAFDAREIRPGDTVTVYVCPKGHLSSVGRPQGERVRCFSCPTDAQRVEVTIPGRVTGKAA